MILVCGEALIDVFAAARTATGFTLDAQVGGSPFNVAVGLARLGRPVGLLASISRGFLGERLMQALVDEGVDVSAVQRNDARTTLGLVGLDAQGVPSYAFYGDDAADRCLDVNALDALPPGVDAVHFGSFAMVVEPIASTLQALAERVHGRLAVSYDANVRLNVEPDLASWRRTVLRMLARCDLVKVSEEDHGILWPGEGTQAFVATALGAGAQLVVVTHGAGGAAAWTAQAHARVPAWPATVADTVGAGDSFMAALLATLADGRTLSTRMLGSLSAGALEAALTFASRAAAVTCSRRGADLPRRSELP